jgi:hypothetical protein
MATLAVFALCHAAVVPWWSLWLALAFDTVATLGITAAISAAGRRHVAHRLPWTPDGRPESPLGR